MIHEVTATASEVIPGDECIVEMENYQLKDADTYIVTAAGLSNSNCIMPDSDTAIG